MNFDWDSHSAVSVSQGEYKLSNDSNIVFSTLLGSCVSVCLFDDRFQLGGLNHFLLPGGDGLASSGEKFGAYAMEILINELLKSGATRESLSAKVFGGGAMSVAHERIGRSNSDFAISYLQSENISCIGSSIGGTLARRIQFHPTSGRVRQFLVPDKVDHDSTLMSNLPQSDAAGSEIVLF